MNICKRILSTILALATILSFGLVAAQTVSADEAAVEPASYKLYHASMNDISNYNEKGLVSTKVPAVASLMENLYAQKQTDVVFVGSKSASITYLCKDLTGSADTVTYPFSGLLTLKSKIGDWTALKFRSPGTGLYSINLDIYFHNANCSGKLDVYLLPGNTTTAVIDDKLTDDNKIGIADVNSSKNKVELSRICSVGTELEAGKEYILVAKVTEDTYNNDNRVDMMFTGISFDAGFTQGEGAFDPVAGQVVVEDALKTAQFYRAINGVNPANGHDLLYLMFKGSMMLVYDVDEKRIIDEEGLTQATPFGQCFDGDGNLWVSGAAMYFLKYDPTTGKSTQYPFEHQLFQEKRPTVNAYGLVYGDDGYIYFGYWGYLGRLDPKTGKTINLSGTQLTTNDKASDAQFTGHGGIVYKDGFLYMCIHGDLNGDLETTSQLIKYDIAQRKIVDFLDVSDTTVDAAYGINYLDLAGDILIGTANRKAPLFVDISGDKMVRLDTLDGLITEDGVSASFAGRVSSCVNGKYYMTGYVDTKETARCLYEFDPETRTVTRLSEILYLNSLLSVGAVATIEDENLPGFSLITPMNNTATGMVDLIIYNTQSNETVIWDSISFGYGSGMPLRIVRCDPTGRYVYIGAYGTNLVGRYDIETGETLVTPGYGHQTDSMFWYKDTLWIGNYDTGAITRYDPVTYDATALVDLMDTVFQQKRMFGLVAADNKVFCTSVPDTGRIGGALTWYDMESDLTYVAAGPNPEDVYYARTTGSFMVWRNAVTHQVETFDVNGDGLYDFDYILDDKGDNDPTNDIKQQRFYGFVPNQCANGIGYKDGYIYGTTTRSGGQAAVITPYKENAQLFVYDVKNMHLVSTCDVADYITGLENPATGYIEYVNVLQEDPYEDGKFWGVIYNTLFSCKLDMQTLQFVDIKEELSFAKTVTDNQLGWKGADIVFDGDYMYVSFVNYGTWMVNTADPSQKYQIADKSTYTMQQGADGNLYYYSMQVSTTMTGHLMKFEIADKTQKLVANSVQAVIDALPETVTAANEAQVMTAYRMYTDLSKVAKDQVNAGKLTAALASLEGSQAAKADQLIEAIGAVTLQSEDAIRAARNYYDALPAETQAKVTKVSVLEAAEAALADLKLDAANNPPKPNTSGNSGNTGNGEPKANSTTIVIVAIGAVVLLIAAAVVLVLLRKKKPTTEE